MSTLNSNYSSLFNWPISLQNARMVKISGNNLSTGDNDLYAVPSGKKLLLVRNRAFNPSAGTIAVYGQVKISGSYYRLGATSSLTTGTAGTPAIVTFVFEAGESVSLNTATTNGLNYFAEAIEFDAATPLFTERVLGLSSGENTILTCPSGKQIIVHNHTQGLGNTSLSCINVSGSNKTYYLSVVASGDTPDSTNRMSSSATVSTGNSTSFAAHSTLTVGDYFSINCSSGTATQYAFITYSEI